MTYQELLHQLNIFNNCSNKPYNKNWYLSNRQILDMKNSYKHNHPVYMKVYPSYVTVSSSTPFHMSKYIFIYGRNQGVEFSAVVKNDHAVPSSNVSGTDSYDPMGDLDLSKYVYWTGAMPESLKGPVVNFASTPINKRKLPIPTVHTKVVHDKSSSNQSFWSKLKNFFK